MGVLQIFIYLLVFDLQKMQKIVSISLLLALGALSLVALNNLNKGANMFVSRTLLSSGDDDCDMEQVVRGLYEEFNMMSEMLGHQYTEDAQRYLNGKLDDGTNGRPFSYENLQCIHSEHKVSVTIGDVVTNGDDTAIFSGTINIDNKHTGLAGVYKFHPGSCKITDESMFFGTNSAAFCTWMNEIACPCFPTWREMGVCTAQAGDAEIDVVERTTMCWDHLSNGNAGDFAACFVPRHGININGESRRGMIDLSDSGMIAQLLQSVDYSHEITSIAAEGYDVHVQVRVTVRNARGAGQVSFYMFQHIEYNREGLITNIVEVFDDATQNEVNAWTGSPPTVSYWETEAAAAVADFSMELGFPSEVVNAWDALNLAHWSMPSGAYSCFDRVTIMDEVYRTSGLLARNVFADVTMSLMVPADRVADVLAVSETISVDRSGNRVTVTESSLGAAVVALVSAQEVAGGRPLAQVQADFSRRFAAAYDSQGNLSNDYRNMLNSLSC